MVCRHSGMQKLMKTTNGIRKSENMESQNVGLFLLHATRLPKGIEFAYNGDGGILFNDPYDPDGLFVYVYLVDVNSKNKSWDDPTSEVYRYGIQISKLSSAKYALAKIHEAIEDFRRKLECLG